MVPRPKTEHDVHDSIFCDTSRFPTHGVFFPIRSSVTRSPLDRGAHRLPKTSQNSLQGLAIQKEIGIESPKISLDTTCFIPWHDHDQQSSSNKTNPEQENAWSLYSKVADWPKHNQLFPSQTRKTNNKTQSLKAYKPKITNQFRLHHTMTTTSFLAQRNPTEEARFHKEPNQMNETNGNEHNDNENHKPAPTTLTCPRPSVRILDPSAAELLVLEEKGVTEMSIVMATSTEDGSIRTNPIAIAIPLGADDDPLPTQDSTTTAAKPLPPHPFPGTFVALLCSGTILLGFGALVAKVLKSYNNVPNIDEIW